MFRLIASWVALRTLLGPFWTSLGEALGLSWAPLGRSWGPLGLLLGRSGALLGRSWAGLWRNLVLLDASGPLWGRPGQSQEPPETLFRTILGPSGADLGTSLNTPWGKKSLSLGLPFV